MWVREQLCTGCGLCAAQCPQDAICLLFGRAWIDQRRCISCLACVEVCPQGAIGEEVRVSVDELRVFVRNLQQKAGSVIRRIDERA